MRRNDGERNLGGQQFAAFKRENPDKVKGWAPGCTCYPDHEGTAPDDWPTARPRVLDLFGGIGRTRDAGRLLDRETHLVDLHLGYCLTARRRTAKGLPVAKRVETGQASLFEVSQCAASPSSS